MVTSAKMQKTIVVKVTRLVQHKLYHRVIRVTKKFYAHDEKREARQGDTVRIVESRPMSKLKRWRLAEVVTRSTRVDLECRARFERSTNHDSDAKLADGGR